MKGRYSVADDDPLIVHALSRDRAIVGKLLRHAVRVASWQPLNRLAAYLEGFNETILSLTGRMIERSSLHFRHLVDFFNNLDWNPTVGDIDRYPDKTTPALFVVDPFLPDGDSNPHFTVCNVIGTHNPVTEVNIAAKVDGKHRCPHIGRNAIHAAVHGGSARGAFTKSRGPMSYACFNHGVMLEYKGIVVDQFHHGRRDSRLRCVLQQDSPIALAYDEFMFRQSKANDENRDVLKKNFLQLWNDLKAGKEKIKNQHEYNQQISFADAPSPYNDMAMLFEFASIMFKNLVKLL
ncbi:hypothetical protein FOYG_13070 [Fusarium oxysporum NRRL 32931]|uniref:Uncharacterized protein n=1 Tax=Fusarium oxysporum NRRL 32931 TaxID=660029 RepID=W9HSL9_FUSOX|nr:hypothetical protein FOYG_13070 [Fusarium oxysporum NRRL 32931]